MNKIGIVVLLIAPLATPVEAQIIKFQDSPDSFMRTYDQEVTFGNITRGYYTYWTTYVTSNDDKSHWVELLFHFDSSIQKQKIYVVPGHYNYISISGYMKTWTNQVNITVNPVN